MKKVILSLLLLAVIGFCGYYYGSPYLAVYAVQSAVNSGDSDKLSDYIDYPLLRENMKAEFIKNLKDDDKLSMSFGKELAAALVDGLVDAMVTPKGLKAVLSVRDIKGGNDEEQEPEQPKEDKQERKESENGLDMGYEGLSRFVVTVHQKNGETSARVILNRYGLFGWKLTSIEFAE